jgi:glutaredoxin 3
MSSVEIYTRPGCGYCARALALLQSKGADYTEFANVSTDPDKRREMVEKSNGGTTYPQIFIDGRHIGGSDDLMSLERSGQLDKLLAA